MICVSVIYVLAVRECLQHLCQEATFARPPRTDAAIGAGDGALVPGRFANGRAYAKPSIVACGSEGHGPLVARAAGHRRNRQTLLPLQDNARALLGQHIGTRKHEAARALLGGLR